MKSQPVRSTKVPACDHSQIFALKHRCPLPQLMEHLGLGKYAKPSVPSPFRTDNNASWGIFEKQGLWYFKDLGTGDSGDEVGFLARHLRLDSKNDFPVLLATYAAIAKRAVPKPAKGTDSAPGPQMSQELRPDGTGFGPGSQEQLEALAKLRGLSVEGLAWAQDRGLLIFGTWSGTAVYGLKDKSGRVIELRRLDGLDFAATPNHSGHKSHALKHSAKSWPVGILEAQDSPMIVLVEGVPDLLAAHCVVLKEQGRGETARCSVVAMLSASSLIHAEALAHFKAKAVVIFAHADGAGLQGAKGWQEQLIEAGATSVQIFDVSKAAKVVGGEAKDLNDLVKHPKFNSHPQLQNLIPTNL